MRTVLKFEPEMEAAIRAEAESSGRTMAEVVRSCVESTLMPRDRAKIAATAARLIRDGRTNAEVLAGIRLQHGATVSSENSVRWYRATLRRGDPTILQERQARRLKGRR